MPTGDGSSLDKCPRSRSERTGRGLIACWADSTPEPLPPRDRVRPEREGHRRMPRSASIAARSPSAGADPPAARASTAATAAGVSRSCMSATRSPSRMPVVPAACPRAADPVRRRSRCHDRAPARSRVGRRVRGDDQQGVVGEGRNHETITGPQSRVACRAQARRRPANPPSCRECQRRRGPCRR